MRFKIKSIIALIIFLNYQVSQIKCQSINVANSFVQWNNLGSETEFIVTSKLNGFSAKNAWIAVGINSVPRMVSKLLMKKIFTNFNVKIRQEPMQ